MKSKEGEKVGRSVVTGGQIVWFKTREDEEEEEEEDNERRRVKSWPFSREEPSVWFGGVQ